MAAPPLTPPPLHACMRACVAAWSTVAGARPLVASAVAVTSEVALARHSDYAPATLPFLMDDLFANRCGQQRT